MARGERHQHEPGAGRRPGGARRPGAGIHAEARRGSRVRDQEVLGAIERGVERLKIEAIAKKATAADGRPRTRLMRGHVIDRLF